MIWEQIELGTRIRIVIESFEQFPFSVHSLKLVFSININRSCKIECSFYQVFLLFSFTSDWFNFLHTYVHTYIHTHYTGVYLNNKYCPFFTNSKSILRGLNLPPPVGPSLGTPKIKLSLAESGPQACSPFSTASYRYFFVWIVTCSTSVAVPVGSTLPHFMVAVSPAVTEPYAYSQTLEEISVGHLSYSSSSDWELEERTPHEDL